MDTQLSRTEGLVRVPAITLWFWIVKILTTAVGEASSDFLGQVSPGVAGAVGGLGLIVALVLQFRMHRYVAWTYWFAVVMVAIFGTMFADVLHSGLKISYEITAVALLIVLAVVFTLWYRSEGTLSIHSITNRRREAFYWGTVIATFALGTAVGDLTASNFGWGFLNSGIIFTASFALVGIVHYFMRRGRSATSGVLAFWIAYILTRPLGASFADWMGEPPEKGGLGWGFGNIAIVLFVLIIGSVAYLAVTKRDVQRDASFVDDRDTRAVA